MKQTVLFIFSILILTASGLFAQQTVRIGMTAEEFRTKLPGIIPDVMDYNKEMQFKEKQHNIAGQWTFRIKNNFLLSASFQGDNRVIALEDFDEWTESARLIIADYTKTYGKPKSYENGECNYIDPLDNSFSSNESSRALYHEAVWETKTTNIKITCDYRSNYFEDFDLGTPSGPREYCYYYFCIEHSPSKTKTDAKEADPGRFFLGMSVDDFAKKFPSLFPKGVKISGQWGRDEDLHGLAGDWTYRFEDGILTWIHFQKYYDDITATNFQTCLSATNQLISEYTAAFGKPDNTIVGDTTFIDPYKKHHWGYDVKEVQWKNYQGMKIKIEFSFLGGKGDYNFMVVVNYFDKDYPYFD
ncbi:MAG: hypothetical protein KKD31_03545 [Bacteroidetes bacterium]|nr:hypothetical protein [Bacteroidota bacterium]